VSALIVSWEGFFFSAYGQKRGETLATKHDIDLVLEQLEKATKLTENIRSEIISDKSIAKQRHEDIKRDAALDVMRIEGEFEHVLNSLFFLEQGMETAREKNKNSLASEVARPSRCCVHRKIQDWWPIRSHGHVSTLD
jgi:hypothetical protein